MPPAWEIVEDAGALSGADREAWDALAIAAGRPFCAPGWLLPWWRHVAPAGARLRLVLVREPDGGRGLAGVAPYFEDRRRGTLPRWRPLAAGTCEHVEPLARTGEEREVAAAVAAAMAQRGAWAVTFEGVPADSPWPALLRDAWPGTHSAWLQEPRTMTALLIGLEGRDFEAWFAAKTSHFRQRLRKNRKELVKRDGETRVATDATVNADLDAFVRLHRARRLDNGKPTSVTPAVGRMLADVAAELPVGDRLRVWSMDADGATVASSVVLVAGDEVGYWLNGFDERIASISPSRLSILTVVEDAFALGAARLDLGAGDFDYKRRFADDEETLHWRALVPAGPRAPLVRAQLAAPRAARAAADRMDPELKAKLRDLQRRATQRLGGSARPL